MVQMGQMRDVYPITGSHEPAGEVVVMGEEARKLGKFDIGSRVGGILIRGPCGQCVECRRNTARYCPKATGHVGISVDGAFAEYTLLDARYTVALPDSITWDQAAPQMCAGVTVYKALKVAAQTANLSEGSVVAIVGLGALGHIAVQMARAMVGLPSQMPTNRTADSSSRQGYTVIGVDSRKEPIELAQNRVFQASPHAQCGRYACV